MDRALLPPLSCYAFFLGADRRFLPTAEGGGELLKRTVRIHGEGVSRGTDAEGRRVSREGQADMQTFARDKYFQQG